MNWHEVGSNLRACLGPTKDGIGIPGIDTIAGSLIAAGDCAPVQFMQSFIHVITCAVVMLLFMIFFRDPKQQSAAAT
jgi:hypothetical protein